MFAIIEFKNNQYKVKEDDFVSLPNFDYDQKEKKVIFDKVLLIGGDDKELVGTPTIKDANVTAEVIENFRTNKVRVFKFRAKKRYQRTKGQRQAMVKVKINKINLK